MEIVLFDKCLITVMICMKNILNIHNVKKAENAFQFHISTSPLSS